MTLTNYPVIQVGCLTVRNAVITALLAILLTTSSTTVLQASQLTDHKINQRTPSPIKSGWTVKLGELPYPDPGCGHRPPSECCSSNCPTSK